MARPVVPTRQRSTSRGRHAKRERDPAIVAEGLVKQFVAGHYPGLVVGSPLAERPAKPSRNPAFAKVTGKRPCKRGKSLMADSDENTRAGESRGELSRRRFLQGTLGAALASAGIYE